MTHRRHYTVDEANRELTAVGAIVRRLRDAHRRLGDEGSNRDFTTHADLSGGAWPGAEHARAALDMALGYDRLEELDVVVRDLERGLIDFPSLIGGEEVYLCWLLDEPSVGHWHTPGGGFSGRRPLG